MHPDGGNREEDKKLLIFISNAVMRDEIKKSRHREAFFKKGGCGLHLQIMTINGSQELIISTSNWHQGKLTSLFRLAFNKFFAFFCDLAIPPRMTSL